MDEEIIIETLDRVEQELHNIRVEIHNLNKNYAQPQTILLLHLLVQII